MQCSRASSNAPLGSLQSGENALASSRTPRHLARSLARSSFYRFSNAGGAPVCWSVKRFFSSVCDTARSLRNIFDRGNQECRNGVSVRLDLPRYYTAGSPSSVAFEPSHWLHASTRSRMLRCFQTRKGNSVIGKRDVFKRLSLALPYRRSAPHLCIVPRSVDAALLCQRSRDTFTVMAKLGISWRFARNRIHLPLFY